MTKAIDEMYERKEGEKPPNKTENRKPVAKETVQTNSGLLQAAIWEQENGGYQISFQKSYKKEQEGEWQNTQNYFVKDLPTLALLAQKVWNKLEDKIQ